MEAPHTIAIAISAAATLYRAAFRRTKKRDKFHTFPCLATSVLKCSPLFILDIILARESKRLTSTACPPPFAFNSHPNSSLFNSYIPSSGFFSPPLKTDFFWIHLFIMKILDALLYSSVFWLLLLHCSGGHGIHEEQEEDGDGDMLWASEIEQGRSSRGRELLMPSAVPFNQTLHIDRYIVVEKHGDGDYKKVQDAIDSVPDRNQGWVYIQINAGVYNEKVTISYTQPFVILQGAGMSSTIISWGDTASSLGTANSATFSANADNFIAKGIGFHNSAPPASPGASGGQAVAVLAGGDKMAFYKCGFYGAQDTLFDALGRHYFKNCYIEGSIDFIFGHGRSTYKGCELNVKAQEGYISGSITAQNRDEPSDMGGFVFVQCNITGTGEVFLGRAWGAYSRVIFMYTYMPSIIIPQGWFDWGKPSRQSTVYYGEYKCYGPGADYSNRVSWSRQLSDEEAEPFLQISYIDGDTWLQET